LTNRFLISIAYTGLTRIIEEGKSSAGDYTSRPGSSTLNAAKLATLSNGPPLTASSRLGMSRRDDRSESGYSVGSNVSVAESIISKAVSRKGKF
jgi:hypothetical protein